MRIEPVAVVAQSLACATSVGLAIVAAGQSHVDGIAPQALRRAPRLRHDVVLSFDSPRATMIQASPVHDLVIMGGGLAGLSLALQLRQRLPDLRVLVLERRAHPVPEACHKVGESTVEIGAHYFENVLGLKQHLVNAQLKKFGFRFFFSEGRRDFDAVTELSIALQAGAW